jgi:hypothetical protein
VTRVFPSVGGYKEFAPTINKTQTRTSSGAQFFTPAYHIRSVINSSTRPDPHSAGAGEPGGWAGKTIIQFHKTNCLKIYDHNRNIQGKTMKFTLIVAVTLLTSCSANKPEITNTTSNNEWNFKLTNNGHAKSIIVYPPKKLFEALDSIIANPNSLPSFKSDPPVNAQFEYFSREFIIKDGPNVLKSATSSLLNKESEWPMAIETDAIDIKKGTMLSISIKAHHKLNEASNMSWFIVSSQTIDGFDIK